MPWQALIDLIEPHYPKASKKGGRPPYPLATMLRIHRLQQWSSLSDPAMEEALIEVPTMRRFAGIELISDRIPDETTILTFRHLLEKHGLGEQVFETVKAHLSERGMTMRQGNGIQGGDATRQTQGSTGYSRWKAGGSDRDSQGPHPLQGRASLPGDQAAVRLSEDPAAWPGPTEATGRAWRSHSNRCKIHVLAALSNLDQARRPLLATA